MNPKKVKSLLYTRDFPAFFFSPRIFSSSAPRASSASGRSFLPRPSLNLPSIHEGGGGGGGGASVPLETPPQTRSRVGARRRPPPWPSSRTRRRSPRSSRWPVGAGTSSRPEGGSRGSRGCSAKKTSRPAPGSARRSPRAPRPPEPLPRASAAAHRRRPSPPPPIAASARASEGLELQMLAWSRGARRLPVQGAACPSGPASCFSARGAPAPLRERPLEGHDLPPRSPSTPGGRGVEDAAPLDPSIHLVAQGVPRALLHAERERALELRRGAEGAAGRVVRKVENDEAERRGPSLSQLLLLLSLLLPPLSLLPPPLSLLPPPRPLLRAPFFHGLRRVPHERRGFVERGREVLLDVEAGGQGGWSVERPRRGSRPPPPPLPSGGARGRRRPPRPPRRRSGPGTLATRRRRCLPLMVRWWRKGKQKS